MATQITSLDSRGEQKSVSEISKNPLKSTHVSQAQEYEATLGHRTSEGRKIPAICPSRVVGFIQTVPTSTGTLTLAKHFHLG